MLGPGAILYNQAMLAFITTAARTLAWRYRAPGPRLGATAQEICTHAVERLWSGEFYQTGLGHFDYFWMRDFGVVARALIATGSAARAQATARWALGHYEYHGRITTCIDAHGRTFDAPTASVDALPWLLDTLIVCSVEPTPAQREFLQAALAQYCAKAVDADGLPREGQAELRDAVIYRQSAYALCMLEVLKRSARTLGLAAPVLERQDYPALLLGKYWNGAYFNADADTRAFSAECNLLPFWLGIINDPRMLDSVLRVVKEKHLTDPCPMRYTDLPAAFRYRWWAKLVMRNYAGTTIWSWMGALYLDLLARAGNPNYGAERAKFDAMLVRTGTFPELLNPDGTPYQTRLYRAGHGMLWAALYLALPDPV